MTFECPGSPAVLLCLPTDCSGDLIDAFPSHVGNQSRRKCLIKAPAPVVAGTKYIDVPYNALQVRDKHMMLPGATKESLRALPEFNYAS
jgi:hypothetical protein